MKKFLVVMAFLAMGILPLLEIWAQERGNGTYNVTFRPLQLWDKELSGLHQAFPVAMEEARKTLREEFLAQKPNWQLLPSANFDSSEGGASGPSFPEHLPQHLRSSYHWFLMEKALVKAKGHISLENPLTLDDFASLEEFTDYLVSRNLVHLPTKDKDLDVFFTKLEDFLLKLEAIKKLNMPDQNKNLEISPKGFQVVMEPLNFSRLLQERPDHSDHHQLSDLYQFLIEDENFLKGVKYMDPADAFDNDRCEVKKHDLAKLFNEVTNLTHFITQYQGFGSYGSTYQGRSEEFKSEILYKLKFIAEKVMQAPLDKDQKTYLLQNLLHAGRHCPDAKGNVVLDNLFPIFCPQEEQKLEDAVYPRQDLYSRSFVSASKLKKQILDHLITTKVPLNGAESITIRAATWDKLAPLVGLPKVQAAYPNWAKDSVTLKDFFESYTAKNLISSYTEENKARFEYELGPLREFVPDFSPYYQTVASAELQRFDLLAPISAQEKDLLEQHKKLKLVRLYDQSEYDPIVMLTALQREDYEWAKDLRQQGRPQELNERIIVPYFLEKQVPHDEFGLTTYFDFLLHHWKGDRGGDEIVKDIIKQLPPRPDIMLPQDLPPLIKAIKFGNEKMIRIMLEQGMSLTSDDWKILPFYVKEKGLQLLQNLFHETHPDLVKEVAEKLKSDALLPEGFKESFRSGGLIWGEEIDDNVDWDKAYGMCRPPLRLPTKAEYEALAREMGVGKPGGYNPQYFPGVTMTKRYWTSDLFQRDLEHAYFFKGHYGEMGHLPRHYRGYVRCVFQP